MILYVCVLQVLLLNTGVGDRLVNERTRELLLEEPDNAGYVPPVRVGQAVKWSGKKTVAVCSQSWRIWIRSDPDHNDIS